MHGEDTDTYDVDPQMFQMSAHMHPEREQRHDVPRYRKPPHRLTIWCEMSFRDICCAATRLSMVPTNVKSLQREVESLKEEIRCLLLIKLGVFAAIFAADIGHTGSRRMRSEKTSRAEEKGLAQVLCSPRFVSNVRS